MPKNQTTRIIPCTVYADAIHVAYLR